MFKLFSICVIICISSIIPTYGQTDGLVKALQFAQDGKNKDAIQIYEQVIEDGEASADLYYNLGTLYLQEKQIAKSILYLERTIKHQPNHKDACANLDIAQAEINDPIFAISPFFLVSYWKSFSNILPMLVWGILSLLFLLALVFLLNRILFGKMSKKSKWISVAMVMSGLVLSLAAAWTRYADVKNDSFAIVMAEVDRLEGPDDKSINEEFPIISEGIKVKIKDSFEDFYKVKLPDSDESWIPKDKLEKI